MQLYSIPALSCPFPTIENPSAERQIELHTSDWLTEFNLAAGDKHRFYIEQRFAAMIARSYPLGDLPKLFTWCDLNTLLFILDDQLDEDFIIKDIDSLNRFTDEVLEVLEGDKYYTLKNNTSFFAALSDFWIRIKKQSSKHWQNIFIQNIRDMFAGGLWQLEHFINKTKPSYSSYLEHRAFLGAAHLATDSLEITANVFLKPEIYLSQDIQELIIDARNAICFANDLFSLGKEIANSAGGAEFNLVSIISRENNISIEDAIIETANIHDQQVQHFIEVSKRAKIYDAATNDMVQRLINGLGYLMKGNIDWSTKDTTRYPHIYIHA